MMMHHPKQRFLVESTVKSLGVKETQSALFYLRKLASRLDAVHSDLLIVDQRFSDEVESIVKRLSRAVEMASMI